MGWLAAAPFSISRRPCANSKPPALLTHMRSQVLQDYFDPSRSLCCGPRLPLLDDRAGSPLQVM
jgi:hypothetical protein